MVNSVTYGANHKGERVRAEMKEKIVRVSGLTSILPLLDTGEALMLGDAVLLPSRIRLDKPVITPDSATRDFWKEWGCQPANTEAINLAVEALRSQTRDKPC